MFSFRLSGALLPESECKVTPKILPHQIFRKENYTTKTNFFDKTLQFSTISHQKKSQKKATSVVDPILPAGYRHIPAKFVTLNPRSKTRGEDSPLLFI